MTDVLADCPQCGEKISFYRTVDELKECPECGTYWEDLFDIALGTVDEGVGIAAADGGVVVDE